MRKPDKQSYKLTLLLPAVLLTACAATLPPQTGACPQLPEMPSLSTPLPQTSYSLSAAERSKSWQQKLTATRLMSD